VRDFVATMGRAAGPGRFGERVDVEVSLAPSVEVGELIERAESMSVLRDLLAGVRSASKGRLVLVGGEAGVGKTALLRRFCDALGDRVVVLWAGCEPLRTPRPLGPLLDVAEAVGGEFEELVAGVARPHDVALALLRQLRSARPTVLVIEDVHWADEATLDVLTLLARRIESVPALVLASHRDDERDSSAQLRTVLAEVGRGQGRLTVVPLSRAGVAELAEPYGVDGEELYRRTGGNPFFVGEILAAPGEGVPESVRDAVLARASRLSEPARRVLEAVAIIPGQVDYWLLEKLLGELVDRVDECLASGMLTSAGSQVSFRHELARLAIEESTPPSRRVALHREALGALVAAEKDFARLAHHADGAGDVEAVLRWAPLAAARAASSGSHREAVAHYSAALRFADGLPLETRAELLQGRANECFLTDQFDEAIVAQREALECHQQLGDRLGEGDALRRLGRLLSYANRHDESRPLSVAAVELLEQLPVGPELAMAYSLVAEDQFVYHDLDAALQWGTRALELATRLEDTEGVVSALENIGSAEFQGGSDDGRKKLEQALALAEQNGLREYAGRAFILLVRCCTRLRRPTAAGEYADAGLEYCVEQGLETWRLYLLASRARVELNLGRWDEASGSAALALRDPRSAPVVRVYASVALGLVRARRGDPAASDLLEDAHTVVAATGQLEWITLVAAARAEAAWLVGDHATVKQVTDAGLALALECQEPWSIAELAYWRWLTGVQDELPEVDEVVPYRLSIAGEWAQAAKLWRDIGCPYEAALALAGADDETALRRAHDELQALGTRPAVAIVARRLRERGARGVPRGPRRQTRANPAGLTGRELEVLALLVEGMRNAEIAERLVISKKTVDHHVSAVLRKLDARTRGEASAAASNLGLLRHDHRPTLEP
jgi:DNA-binding CsgD family transcriptional regulator/tetratricopeptide (TPR) repeat protein